MDSSNRYRLHFIQDFKPGMYHRVGKSGNGQFDKFGKSCVIINFFLSICQTFLCKKICKSKPFSHQTAIYVLCKFVMKTFQAQSAISFTIEQPLTIIYRILVITIIAKPYYHYSYICTSFKDHY